MVRRMTMAVVVMGCWMGGWASATQIDFAEDFSGYLAGDNLRNGTWWYAATVNGVTQTYQAMTVNGTLAAMRTAGYYSTTVYNGGTSGMADWSNYTYGIDAVAGNATGNPWGGGLHVAFNVQPGADSSVDHGTALMIMSETGTYWRLRYKTGYLPGSDIKTATIAAAPTFPFRMTVDNHIIDTNQLHVVFKINNDVVIDHTWTPRRPTSRAGWVSVRITAPAPATPSLTISTS